jgi:hypothetical protein
MRIRISANHDRIEIRPASRDSALTAACGRALHPFDVFEPSSRCRGWTCTAYAWPSLAPIPLSVVFFFSI